MGSLPSPAAAPPSSPASLAAPPAAAAEIAGDDLRRLFDAQQAYLNHFFDHLDLPQALSFTRALLRSAGTIFFSGVGKSGLVARKISQTLVSLGVPSSFLSPLDALHGDIGALSPADVLVLLSKSGNTDELLKLVPSARSKGCFLISVTSVKGNLLEGVCDMNVHLPVERELCPFDLAPVTSTAIQMVFGDTVAIALMQAKGLTKEQYAGNHPAGRIGKCLTFKVCLFVFVFFRSLRKFPDLGIC